MNTALPNFSESVLRIYERTRFESRDEKGNSPSGAIFVCDLYTCTDLSVVSVRRVWQAGISESGLSLQFGAVSGNLQILASSSGGRKGGVVSESWGQCNRFSPVRFYFACDASEYETILVGNISGFCFKSNR